MSEAKAPRTPTPEEIEELIQHLVENGLCREDAELDVASNRIAVFDHYMTDGPGYTGKVMLVLWSGSPGCISSYTFHPFAEAAATSD